MPATAEPHGEEIRFAADAEFNYGHLRVTVMMIAQNASEEDAQTDDLKRARRLSEYGARASFSQEARRP
jgi:hypothetical protein